MLLLFREEGMNKDNASKWIGLGSAMLQGKTIQLLSHGAWRDIAVLNTVSFDPESYRIKPEPKKQSCRMYLVKSTIAKTGEPFYTAIASNSNVREIDDIESSPIFVRWLTDVIEYEIPE